jgi:hypothetical protein
VAALILASAALLFLNRPAPQQISAPAPSTSAHPADHAHTEPHATAPHRKLPVPLPPRATSWELAADEPACAAFAAWSKRHAAAPPADQAALAGEGERLARERLVVLARLIATDPERALALAVPPSVRAAMPANVRALLEETVNARGDYQVLCPLAPPDKEHKLEPFIRSARVGDVVHRVFAFGAGREYVTRPNVPLNGIAVPLNALATPPADPAGLGATKLMALDPSPVRLLDETEAAAGRTGVEFAGAKQEFNTLAQALTWAADVTAGAHLDTPATPSNLPTAEDTYTEGRKRFLVMRVDFPDYAVDAFPTNTAVQHMRNMSNFLGQISYYRHVIAPVGQGSDITPLMRMTNNASAYDNAGLSKLYPEAQATARDVHGYDLSKYDFFFVCTGGQPSYGYAGLGYVGGVGYHLANGYFDVRTSAHEFGHNLGLSHANYWDGGGRSTIGAGTHEEYGDPFDTMGSSGDGSRHFSASFKNRLGWIPGSNTTNATVSGTYRLHAHDIATAPIGLRAIRLNRASGDPYWIEFRQLWTGNKAMMNGINFRWAGGASELLDMTPGSSGGKDDHSLTIGRTFSDWSRNFHVTPTRKANTHPESIDVVINLGPFATNVSPVVVAGASALSASTGQTITFTAAATDANGDTLAYAWDFGDGDYSVDNSAVTTHSFGSAGEYPVVVTVSDMKGGVARDSVIVTIGAPTAYAISGRVFNANGTPLAGIRVYTSSTKYAFTENDGSYTIANLAAGNYTVTAVDPVTDSYAFDTPFFNNPLTVGPDFANADFMVGVTPPPTYTTLIASNSSWRYLDDGSNQGAAWAGTAFDDSGWASGPGVLGFTDGNDTITTTNSYGPDPNNKYVTTYYRRAFTIASPAAFTGLQLNLLRDDGAVVYLNGSELLRDNMPAGGLTHTTLASASASEPWDYDPFTLSATGLVSGSNFIAVEVHQSSTNSSDLGFDLGLVGVTQTNNPAYNIAYLSAPAANATFANPTNIPLSAYARSTLGAVSLVDFYADGVKIGSDATSPYSLTWTNPSVGAHTLRIVATVGAISFTSQPVAVTITAPLPPAVALSFIQTNASWRYFCTNVGAPAGWQNIGFNDATWSNGIARLGFNSGAGGGTNINTVYYGGPSAARYPAAYFRTAFVVNDPAAVTNLTATFARDDGIVVYLNGVELFRDNMPTGAISYATQASGNATDNAQTYFTFTTNLSGSLLVPGTNILAAELHQATAGSSDAGFDLWLEGRASTNRARGCWLVAPAAGTNVNLPATISLTAHAVAGGNLGVAKVEFYAGAVKIGEATNSPFTLNWPGPVAGAHSLTAVAVDSAADAVTSAPVAITVSAAPMGEALISFSDVWKYLDDGSDQRTGWSARLFNDNQWMSGPAKLGYGGDGEITTVSYGTNASVKHVTTYFRKQFVIASPAAFSGLLLRLVRDDGVVVYINGTEVLRSNLLSGLVGWNSLATAAVGGADETTPVDLLLGVTNLVAGTNTVAVEIHQESVASSDVGFDLALVGLRSTNMANGIYITSPANNAHYNVPANIPLAAYAASSTSTVALVEYFAGTNKVGQSTTTPYSATWTNAPVGTHSIAAVGSLASGAKMTSAPVTVVVGPVPPPITPVYARFIDYGSTWRFWDNVAAVSNGWQQLDFDDSGWPSGPARLGWGFDGELTLLTEGRITHYFRRAFMLTNGGALDSLTFSAMRDDGVVVYLNGREVFRANMPAGPVTAATLASTTINTPDETIPVVYSIPTPGSGLLHGTNVVAVELHQSSATSSDAGFDLFLFGEGTTEPRVYLTAPTNNSTLVVGDAVTFDAQAEAASGRTLGAVEFFANGMKFGMATNVPYRVVWAGAEAGTNLVVARTVDDLGNSVTSAPVQLFFGYETVSLVLVPSNSVWRYLDNGSNQGTNWAQPAYSDLTWSNGTAQLGYGGNGEETVISYGPNASSKYITTYFRHAFIVPPNTYLTNLTFELLRDDGAVVWLNGREMYRSNMPTNAITYTTPASTSVSDGAPEHTFYVTTLAATNAVPGTNVLAVEIHQSAANSSDLGFNLQLSGSGYIHNPVPPSLAAVVNSSGAVELAWPAAAAGWSVYSSPQLGTGAAWQLVNAPVVSTSGQWRVTVPPSNAAAFFRLRK